MPQIKEPKPETLRIEELVDRVKQGDIKIPKFQRPFVWKRRAVLDLFDSVYRQYPIGSILLWLTHEKLASERQIGDLEIVQRPSPYPVNYLLDGQQRLASLCGALYWDSKNPSSLWNVAFDLDTELFFHPTKPLTVRQFPLNKLIKITDFLAQCRILEAQEDKVRLLDTAEKLLKSIKDYKMAAVTIGDMTISEVAPIFERINSKGRNLEMVDLMRAATWKDGQNDDGFDLNATITEVREALEQKNFSSVPESHILRSLSASADLGIYRESISNLRDKNAAELRAAAEAATEGYRKAVDFLTSELGLSSYAYVPYAHQLTLLVEFFRRCPKPSHDQRKVLTEWFWRTSFSEYFQLFSTGDQKRDLEVLRNFADGATESLDFEKVINFQAFPLKTFKLNTAASKVFGLLLVEHSPLSLLDGSRIDTWGALSVINRHEYHHIFPKHYLEASGVAPKRVQAHANICLLSKANNREIWNSRPSVYFEQVGANLGANLTNVLNSNLISRDAYEACLRNDYDAFIRARVTTIQEVMEHLANTPAGPAGERLIVGADDDNDDGDGESPSDERDF